jgi:hypothetical protein
MEMKRQATGRIFQTTGWFVGCIIVLWGTAWILSLLGVIRATAAMMLLLEVLVIATRGDWILAPQPAWFSTSTSLSICGPRGSAPQFRA